MQHFQCRKNIALKIVNEKQTKAKKMNKYVG